MMTNYTLANKSSMLLFGNAENIKRREITESLFFFTTGTCKVSIDAKR